MSPHGRISSRAARTAPIRGPRWEPRARAARNSGSWRSAICPRQCSTSTRATPAAREALKKGGWTLPDGSVVLMGVGDVGPIHEPMDAYSVLARPVLAQADIRFGQVERVYSERGSLQVHSGGAHSRCKPHMASVFTDCGFDVVSLASNHAMDWGEEALLDTVALLRGRGMQVIGVGRDLEEA